MRLSTITREVQWHLLTKANKFQATFLTTGFFFSFHVKKTAKRSFVEYDDVYNVAASGKFCL